MTKKIIMIYLMTWPAISLDISGTRDGDTGFTG